MPLTLTDADLARLRTAQTVPLSPLEYMHVDHWGAAVNETLKEVLGVQRTVFYAPMPAEASFLQRGSSGFGGR